MKLTNEQKEANKLARSEARKLAKETAKKEAEKNQSPVIDIDFSIEWKKSKMWGHNPHLLAVCRHKDNTISRFNCTASGCGYDKESQVIADAFNEFLKYKLYQINEANEDSLPYGIYLRDNYKGYAGGIGVNCYYKIAEAIGGKFEQIATGKTFDVYKYTDNK